MAYKLKQVGNPNKMNGKREIIVYKIYRGRSNKKGGTLVGVANYHPSSYKSKYNLDMYPKTYPKAVRDYIIRTQGARDINFKHSGGYSAKNPTAVLKQFKARYEGNIANYKNSIKRISKFKAKKKRSGLSDADYEKLGKLTERIKQYLDDTQKRLRRIKSEKSYVVSNKKWITKWRKEISDLKRRK